MLGLPIEHFITVAQFLGIAAVGLLWVIGGRWGQKTPTPVEKTLEVAGALVDSTAVKELATALNRYTDSYVAAAGEQDKLRRLGHEIVESVDALTNELREVRTEIRLGRR